MTDDELKAIEARANTATPNEWAIKDYREDTASLIAEVRRLRWAIGKLVGHWFDCPFCGATMASQVTTIHARHFLECSMFAPDGSIK